MNTLQADGMTEVTLRGPALQNTHQTAAQRGPAHGDSRRRRGKPNTRRRPRNGNTARRSAPRSKLVVITDQREKGLCLQRGSPEDPLLHPVAPHIDMRHQSGGGATLLCLLETPGPIPDHTRAVIPDPEGGQGHTHGPEAAPGLQVILCPDPNLSPTLAHGPDPDPDPDQDPGTDRGLHLGGGGGGVFPGPQERRNLANLYLTTWSMGLINLQKTQERLS